MFSIRSLVLLPACLAAGTIVASSQERPYFVTYTHYLEEKGNLEIAVATTTGLPRNGNHAYTAPWIEFEAGLTGWWTAELYLEGVTTHGDGNGFTGWRLEHRFRPLPTEHRVNPVLYVEYEDINEASRIQKEIVGAGAISYEPIRDLRSVHAREIEGKLILSSAIGDWNVAENFIFEKNLSKSEGVEFGYAVGVSRPLGALASGQRCRLCAESFVIGVEAYGGLGSTVGFDRTMQRHYLAPAVGWQIADHAALKASTAVGLTQSSDRALLRVGLAYELPFARGR